MSDALARLLRGCRRATLGVGAGLGAICILTALTGAVLDVHPLVFRSGSMAPAIDTGALALVERVDAADLRAGDVASVPTGSGGRVTHRIVQVTHAEDRATLQLKGDANLAPDARLYDVHDADRVLFAVPRVGYAIGWLTGPRGLLLLGLYAALLVSVLLRGARTLTIASVALLVTAAGVVRATPGWAAWNDGATVSGTAMGAMNVPSPSSIACSGDLTTTVTISTTAVADSRIQYVARLFTAATGGTQVGPEKVMTANGSARETSYSVSDFPGLGVGTTYYARIHARLAATPTWEAAGNRTISFSATSLVLATVFSCGTAQP